MIEEEGGGGDQDKAVNIRVFLRIKPCPDDQRYCLEHQSPDAVKFTGNQTSNGTVSDYSFKFDGVGGPTCSQAEVWGRVAKEMTEQCLDGYNATVFAYGQTGSGKTFTMQGPINTTSMSLFSLDHGDATHAKQEHQVGLIPRTFDYLFQLIEQDRHWLSTTVRCSFIEIYNETVYDLLAGEEAVRLIREDVKRSTVYVEGAREETVKSAFEASALFSRGTLNRHVAETRMNRESSRSHSIFTLSISRQRCSGDNLRVEERVESKFNLVDLAGSERQHATGTVGVRLKEAGNINKSLLALSNVINSLGDRDTPTQTANSSSSSQSRHVHYRDSKLTFLLRDSLGGNSRTAVIACVSPGWSCQGETLSTLRFAQRAKMIRNRAMLNQNIRGSVEDLQTKLDDCRVSSQQPPS